MVKNGDIIRLEMSGGGFGEAILRPRELVDCDVQLGYVSAAAAKRSCGQSSLRTPKVLLGLLSESRLSRCDDRICGRDPQSKKIHGF
jgi:hypothetical protein